MFLGGALALFLIVSLISWLRFRERDAKFGSSINDFQSQMGMLDPSAKARRSRRRK